MKCPIIWLSLVAVITRSCSTYGFLLQSPSTQTLRHRYLQGGSNVIVPFPQQAAFPPMHAALVQQRRSVSNVQTQGLFGLGGLEIAVILAVAAFIIGPQKLGSMAGQLKTGLDDVPEEFKKIPEEFQKGVEEGEINARSRKAKKMKQPSDDDA